MLLFFRFFISAFVFFLFLSGTSIFAAVGFQSFVPAQKIYLTGANTQVRFDVAATLFNSGSPISAPFLDTNTKTFSGTFYLSGAGWVLMNTGIYSTKIDCGAQPLNNLSSACTLSGSAWSETIGDITFDRRVQYIPTTGTLSGNVSTYIGDVSLSGVNLPLLRASLSGSSYTGMADHAKSLNIANPERYESSGGLWKSTFSPIGIPSLTKTYPGRSTNVDLSLAYQYTLEIVDPNGSKTQYIYDVKNNLPATTLVSGNTIISFCASAAADSRCPLAPMSFEYTVGGVPGATTVADGQSYVDAHMKFRDRYGNQIVGGTVTIEYSTPIKLAQVDSFMETSHFGYSSVGDAINLPLGGILTNQYNDTSSTLLPIPLVAGLDINYSFASYAPGKIKLKSLKYNGVDAGIVTPEVEFTPWYVADSLTASDIRIGKEATFTGVVSNKSSRSDVSPMIIHGISIGIGSYATFADFVSSPMPDCQANQKNMSSYQNACEWSSMDGKYFPALYTKTLNTAGETYSFTGIYSPIIDLPYIPPEPVVVSDYISYVVDGHTVIYPTTSFSLGASTFQNLRVRVLGQSQETSWYNGIAGVRQTKADFLNAVRKRVTLLSRNRTDYSQADYLYSTGSQNIGANTFDSKRSVIVEGNDISINANIASHGKSLTIIALKDPKTGIGGNIHIAQSVTDIHATLIAENSIDSSGDKQLYIHGSIISNNTLGGASNSPVECPYFVATCTLAKAKLYDFEYFRDDYLLLADKTGHKAMSTTAQKYPDTSLIIEYDSRVQQDPPPGLKQ